LKTPFTHTMRFNRNYFLISLLLLLIEIFIGARMHDAFVRPYAGDFLVVILIYCMVRMLFDFGRAEVALGTLLFSYAVEWTQYWHLADHLHLGHHTLARILLGDNFSRVDLACYTFGILTVILIEKILLTPTTNHQPPTANCQLLVASHNHNQRRTRRRSLRDQ